MPEGETFTRCPFCDRWVDRTASDAVYAVKQYDIRGIGQTHGAYFHPCCQPERVGYERRPRPEN
jgi:hypothetical protein